jgi:hypothetical protein
MVVRRQPAHCIRFRLIGMRVAVSGAMLLHFASTDDARANDIAGFTGRCSRAQFGGRQARHFDVQIDAFEQRA